MPLGLDQFGKTYLLDPHIAFLSFAIGGGLFADDVVLFLMVQMMRIVGFRHPVQTPEIVVAYLMLAVQTGTILVDPNGPFVGVEGLILLFLGVTLATGDTPPDGRSAGETPETKNAKGELKTTPLSVDFRTE